MLWNFSLFLLGIACGVDQKPQEQPKSAAPAVLHRLTEDQLNNSLQALFFDASLSRIRLPPDIPMHGFDNNAEMRNASPYLVESFQRSMLTLSAELMEEPGAWLRCDVAEGTSECGHLTLKQVASRAFRRPLRQDEENWILGQFDHWSAESDFSTALQLCLQLILQSPSFLYLIEEGDHSGKNGNILPLTDWEIAARMSFFLWDSMPDNELFEAASQGMLRNRQEIQRQARRMIKDARAHKMVIAFHEQWLARDRVDDADFPEDYFYDLGDEEDFGGFDTELRLVAEEEFKRFIQQSVFGEGTLEALLTSRRTWVSPFTALLYGVDIDDAVGESVRIERYVGIDFHEFDLHPVELPAEQRSGFLTSLTFLAGHAHPLNPSPILRGVFIRERLLCMAPGSPPDDVPPIEEVDESTVQTNRDRYAVHSTNPACSGCHKSIDGAGFPFESYDSLGSYRTMDNGYPVDSSGWLVGTDVDGEFSNAIEMIQALATSRRAHDCAVKNWYRYAMHRSISSDDQAGLKKLQDEFWEDGGIIPNLLVNLVSSDAFMNRMEKKND